jgi:hypothetical protein
MLTAMQIQKIGTLGTLCLVMLFFGAYLPGTCAEPKDEKPPLSPIRITGELLFGVVGGISGGYAGVYAGDQLDTDPYGNTGFILGCAIGTAVGSSIVVYGIGTRGSETGSLLTTLGGSMVGGALGLAGSWIIKDQVSEGIVMFPLLLGPPILATIGFNLTRRYDKHATYEPDESERALINFGDGQMVFAIPTVHFQRNPYVDLLKVGF